MAATRDETCRLGEGSGNPEPDVFVRWEFLHAAAGGQCCRPVHGPARLWLRGRVVMRQPGRDALPHEEPTTVISAIPPWNRVADFAGSSVRYTKRCLVFVFSDGFNVTIFPAPVTAATRVHSLIVFIGG